MNPYHPIFAIGALAVAVLTASAFAYSDGTPAKRFHSLDGLRGILAVLVMINHAANWFVFARTGEWTLPPSRLYTHFGESSVALFFMITAFLFGSKLVDGRARAIDWLRLYVSRVLRLVPLYAFFVGALAALSLIAAHFHLQQSAMRFGLNVLHWLGFTMVDMPAINGFGAPVVGGAAWSLPYEWWFYLALPVMGLVVGVKKERGPVLLASAVMILLAAYWINAHNGWKIVATFLGGWLAVFVARQPSVTRVLTAPVAAAVALAAAALATRMTHGFEWTTTVLLTVSFVIIASGNTLFGVLTSRPVRTLGEMGYSVYLLHGIVLFIAFSLLGGAAARLTPVQHWLVASAGVAATVIVCRATFRTIEAPAMAAVDRTTARLRGLRAS